MAQGKLPANIQDRLENIVKMSGKNPHQKQQALDNAVRVIASFVSVTTASLLQYDKSSHISKVICEVHGERSGFLERRPAIGEEFDEREFKVLYKWLSKDPHEALQFHINQLPATSKERRELQSYAVHSSLYLPIRDGDNAFWGYIELWESRYQRNFDETEIANLEYGCTFITKIITSSQD